MKNKNIIILLAILLMAVFLRFYLLDEVPTGLHADEASQGYNAYSLLKTRKDMYGKSLPILFRANGSYQPPLYTYLTIFPTLIFGNSVFTARLISALAGSVLVLVTFIFVRALGIGSKKEKNVQALISMLIVAISPWAIHYSHVAVEGNLVVPIFVVGILLIALSLKNRKTFTLACLTFGLTTHTYYTERITSLLFIAIFLVIFRRSFKGRIKEIILGLGVVVILLLPHIYLLRTGALTRRFTQVSYISDANLLQGGNLNKMKIISGEFLDHYFYYLSPKNLFIDSGQNLSSVSYDLGVFYPWFLIPLLFGISFLAKKRRELMVKLLVIGLVITPIPAALTGDLFFSLRALSLLWIITITISYGIYFLWIRIKKPVISGFLLTGVVVYSLFLFYTSFFIYDRYESINDNGYSYIKLMDILEEYRDKSIIIDNSKRSWGVGIRMIYLMKVEPAITQNNLASQLTTPYYYGQVNAFETYTFGNISVRAVEWEKDLCLKDTIFVGDNLLVDKSRIGEMGLTEIFRINDIRNNPTLNGYMTNNKNCKEIK